MKISLTFSDEELAPALQRHLDDGTTMQSYVRAAVRFFNKLLAEEKAGSAVGYGNKDRFKTYNTQCSPEYYLSGRDQD